MPTNLSASEKREFVRLSDELSLSKLKFSLLSKFLLCTGILLITTFLARYLDDISVLKWGGGMLVMTLCRIFAHFAYLCFLGNSAKYIGYVRHLENLFHGLTALGVGLLPVFFWPEADPLTEMALVCILAIYAGWSSDLTLGHSRIAILFSLIALAPVLLRLFFFENSLGAGGGVLLLLFYVYISLRVDAMARRKASRLQERITLKQDLAKAARQSIAAARSKKANSEFLAAASHDLRQPIHAARLFISTLEMINPLDRNTRKDLHDKIGLAFTSMEGMLDSLLNLSYLKSGRLQPDIRPFHLKDICSGLCREFSGVAKESAVSLTLIESSVRVNTDAIWLERLLRNLISNAIKYSPRGRVLVGARRKKDCVHIQVIDTGQGIPEPELETMFEEFQSYERDKTSADGSLGLGLAIVYRIVQMLDLGINVQSRVGQGTMFTVIVPLAECRQAAVLEDLQV